MCTLMIDLLIGSTIFPTLFQVLRILTTFNILGQPWIHRVGTIPSSLHHKVKFIHNGQVIIVKFTKYMILSFESVLHRSIIVMMIYF